MVVARASRVFSLCPEREEMGHEGLRTAFLLDERLDGRPRRMALRRALLRDRLQHAARDEAPLERHVRRFDERRDRADPFALVQRLELALAAPALRGRITSRAL